MAVAAQFCSGDDDVAVAWVGDCRAYGWDGTALRRCTDDHTVGEQLRRNGAPWELAREHHNWLNTALSKARSARCTAW
ncbi:hypothetical protein [Streptomyces shenzhenensis]|uniref:hypothetical protein n=1 Tax=Streptomyces shenzhenensis TaxID=943815 RepID=UPI00369B03F5